MSIGKFRNTTLEQATNKKNRNKIVRRRRPPKDISIWITTTMVIITSTVQVRKIKKIKNIDIIRQTT